MLLACAEPLFLTVAESVKRSPGDRVLRWFNFSAHTIGVIQPPSPVWGIRCLQIERLGLLSYSDFGVVEGNRRASVYDPTDCYRVVLLGNHQVRCDSHF